MLLNSEWHVHLTYYLEKSDKKMMDSNLKKSYEQLKKKTALKQNVISGESCNHQACSKGEVFSQIMIILFLMYMSIFRDPQRTKTSCNTRV